MQWYWHCIELLQVSSAYVYKRLRQLEKKHDATLELLGKAVKVIDRLTADVDTLLDGQFPSVHVMNCRIVTCINDRHEILCRWRPLSCGSARIPHFSEQEKLLRCAADVSHFQTARGLILTLNIFRSVMVNWTLASSICFSLHDEAHLVSLETRREQEIVASRWRNQVGQYFNSAIARSTAWVANLINFL
jgi:hypothetical protein